MDVYKKPEGRKVYIWIIPLILLFLVLIIIYDAIEVQEIFLKAKSVVSDLRIRTANSEDEIGQLELRSKNNIVSLENKLKTFMPTKPYIVINTTDNRFSLRKPNGDTIRTGLCSTGKDNIMIKGTKRWVFKTPKGLFTILNKRTSPVWTKPDWAFIEEGLPVPSARSSKRYDTSTLGDYALGLGNGYFIHGTLYQRRLGLPETHGCIRIGDTDLEVIYNTLCVESKVFIY
jgi:lipoprotein-anchoring transpeptidase ErfK/SrfK